MQRVDQEPENHPYKVSLPFSQFIYEGNSCQCGTLCKGLPQLGEILQADSPTRVVLIKPSSVPASSHPNGLFSGAIFN